MPRRRLTSPPPPISPHFFYPQSLAAALPLIVVDVNAVDAVAVASALLQQIHPVPVRLRDERRFPGRCWRGVCVCPSLYF